MSKQSFLTGLLGFFLFLIGVFVWVAPAGASQTPTQAPNQTFTVNAGDDVDDGTCDAGHCSLREAIRAANSTPFTDTITFSLGTLTPTIQISGTLPAITDTVIVDGAGGGSTRVALDGSSATGDGLTVQADNSTLRNLVVHGFPGSGLLITGDGNVVEGSYFGTDHTGTLDRGNGSYGILVDGGSNNRIGGTTVAQRNLVSGNGAAGIRIQDPAASGNVIQGNYVGTDATGTVAIRNDNNGIVIFDSPDNVVGGTESVTVGGPCTGACNLISGNGNGNNDSGIFLGDEETDRTQILGNFIGTDVSGTADLGNRRDGIILYTYTGHGRGGPDFTQIGGVTAAERNLISGNNRYGIHIRAGANGTTIQGNYIGTDVGGTGALGNSQHGIYATNADHTMLGGTAGVTVGGPCTGACNLISGNGTNTGHHGASLDGGVDHVTVQGNFFGTDVSGTQALPNAGKGLNINAQRGMIVGGPDPAARNLASGNGTTGIRVEMSPDTSTPSIVENNYVGTAVDGMSALPNGTYGLLVADCYECVIRNNVLSGNLGDGLYTSHIIPWGGPPAVYFYGNFIGVAADGVTALGNGGNGVTVYGVNLTNAWTEHIRIGGSAPGQGNVIAANAGHGIELLNRKIRDVIIAGNAIGTDAGGTLDLGNGGDGIYVAYLSQGGGNVIGGDTPAHGNVIAYNAGNGVTVLNRIRQTIRQNRIFANGGLGIDLGNDGVTPNDAGDGDGGANGLQNFPVVDVAYVRGGATAISGTLHTISNTLVTVDVYGTGTCDPAGYGEGAVPLGLVTTQTDSAGVAHFNVAFAATVPAGEYVVATATDPDGNTSEFSACVAVSTAGGGLSGTVAPAGDAEVSLYRQTTSGSGTDWWLLDATTATGGNYAFGALPPGSYAVRFRDPAGQYAQEYYAGAYAQSALTPISVTEGITTTGVDATLDPAGQITGTVTLSGTGAPLSGISAVAFHQDGAEWTAFSGATTGPAGAYVLDGLTGGVYRVGFFDPAGVYGHEFYSETLDFALARPVTVTVGTVVTDVNGTLAPPANPLVETGTATGFCSLHYDPVTGRFVLRNHTGDPCDFDVTVPPGLVSCPAGGTLLDVALVVKTLSFPLVETPAGSGIFTGHVSLDGETRGTVRLEWTCSNGGFSEDVGQVRLWDPSGFVTDANTGDPVAGATVTLYQVPDWRPRNHPLDDGPNTCESNLSKPAGQPWSQPAPTGRGLFAAPYTGLISPTLNAQTTNQDGYYGWDVATGCWYVVVAADGYETLTSPVVGVPPAVTDLHLALTPTSPTAISLRPPTASAPATAPWGWSLALLALAALTFIAYRRNNPK